MAQRVAVSFRDDIDGTKAAETVSFALDGASYEIDLSARNARSLRKALAEFQSAGRQLSAGPRRSKAPDERTAQRQPRHRPSAGPSNAEIRSWAMDSGIAVSPRGPIPASLRDQYLAAHA